MCTLHILVALLLASGCTKTDLQTDPFTAVEEPVLYVDTVWTPPVVFEVMTRSESCFPKERANIFGDEVIQFLGKSLGQTDESHWQGVVRYNIRTGRADTLVDQLGRVGLHASVDPNGFVAYEPADPTRGFATCHVPTGQYTFTPLPNLSACTNEDGRFVLHIRENADKSMVEVLRFDARTTTSISMFETPRRPGRSVDGAAMHHVDYWVDGLDTIVYGVFGYYDYSTGNCPAHCFAYSLQQQKLLWVNVFPPEHRPSCGQEMAVDEHNVYQKSWNRIVAYNRETGEERWRKDITQAQIGQSGIMPGGGRVYFLSDSSTPPYNGTFGLDVMTGEQVYFNGNVGGTMTSARRLRNLYAFISTGQGHRIWLFDPETGKYVTSWPSPNCPPGSEGNCGWFADNMNVDPERGYVVAHDFNSIFVFDVSDFLE